MSKVVIQKNICIEPKYLNSKIREYLLQKIKDDFIGKTECSYGYITKVYDNISIIKNIISPSGIGIFFTVKFQVNTVKPEIGSIHEGVIFMIFPNGVFVQVFEKMKVLIPLEKLEKYKFDKSKNSFISEKYTLKVGDKVKVQINIFKYEKQNFNCIGSLKN